MEIYGAVINSINRNDFYNKVITYRFILSGIVLGVLFWIFESAIHVFLLQDTFYNQIFLPSSHEFWMRLVVVSILVIFSVYTQLAFYKQKQMTDRIQNHFQREQKLAEMGVLAAGVAHELKNPINIIYGNIQMLDMEEQDAEKNRIYKTILQQIDRSAKIIDNLLEFSRKREHEIRDVHINNLIEKTLQLVEYEMKLENIVFIRDFQKDLSIIKADSDQLAQVFLSLINNARDAINEKQKERKDKNNHEGERWICRDNLCRYRDGDSRR
ncbi:MAG: hypothetical protein HY279_00585 [Nitrospinae bacterium]|nr:hypothetical protein [Nitrospinota bacterium]